MMINENLIIFLDILDKCDLKLYKIKEYEIKNRFKNNQYYNIKKFCLENELIEIQYKEIILTSKGKHLFNNLKNLRYI